MEQADQKKLMTFIAIVSGIGAAVGIWAYFESKKDDKLKHEVLVMDKQIKELELARRKEQSSQI